MDTVVSVKSAASNMKVEAAAAVKCITKAIIMMVVCTGTMKINFFTKDPQALAGGMGTI